MYIPKHFEAPGQEAVTELLESARLCDLVTSQGGEITCSLLPFLYEKEAGGELGAMQCHMARANPQWRSQPDGEALVIVHGPDAYISPEWYPSTYDHGKMVPTWNYIVANVYGRLVVRDDAAWTDDFVRRLTTRHEEGLEPPWTPEKAPEDYLRAQLRAIVGVEVEITRIEGKWKMGQNREPRDVLGAVEALERSKSDEDRAVAEEMRAALSRRPV